jgi:hypothetical protein
LTLERYSICIHQQLLGAWRQGSYRFDSDIIEHHPGLATLAVKVSIVVLAIVANHSTQYVARFTLVRCKDLAQLNLGRNNIQHIDNLLLRWIRRRPHQAHGKHIGMLLQALDHTNLFGAIFLYSVVGWFNAPIISIEATITESHETNRCATVSTYFIWTALVILVTNCANKRFE